MAVETAVVGRQAITDRDDRLVGYELLFRPYPLSTAASPVNGIPADGDEMTLAMFAGALGVGITRLTGGKTVFFNADRSLIVGETPVAFPPRSTVVEVLETVAMDDDILAGCRRLKTNGFRLAADDFTWSDRAEELLPLMDFVKLDIQATAPDELERLVERCRDFDVQLLAEKVETIEEHTRCRELGFDLFQGYFIGRPRTLSSAALSPSQRNVLRLSHEVLSPRADFDAIEKVLRVEPALTYQLLQLAAIGRLGEARRSVRSIRDALVLMGLNRIRAWVPALLMRPTGRTIDSRLLTVLTRARAVELIWGQRPDADTGYAFTVGMISGFELLLGLPRQTLRDSLDLPDELAADAFGEESELSAVVRAVATAERDGVRDGSCMLCAPAELDRIAADAFGWALAAVETIDETLVA